jgi:dTDP-4-dehydrorhamnose reductase
MSFPGGAPILLVGSGGQVGHALMRALRPLGPIHATDRASLDLTDVAEIRRVIRRLRPGVIVNAAAYTAVDRAEDDETAATAINAIAPSVMGGEAAGIGATLIHFSTDYVFDGASSRPYRETDPPRPINAYGRSKLAGERGVLESGASAFVFRLSWVYDLDGRNFLTTIRRLASERDVLRIVDDQVGLPTWSGAIGDAVGRIVATLSGRAEDKDWMGARSGVYHLSAPVEPTASGGVSWADFAEEILRVAPVAGRAHVRVARISSSEYPTPAARPAYSVMDATRAAETFGVRLPSWREQLRACAEVPVEEGGKGGC